MLWKRLKHYSFNVLFNGKNSSFSSWKKSMQKIKQDNHGQLHLNMDVHMNNHNIIILNLKLFSNLWIATPICKSGKLVNRAIHELSQGRSSSDLILNWACAARFESILKSKFNTQLSSSMVQFISYNAIVKRTYVK